MITLRDRREDIPLLTEAFIERLRLKTRKPITGISKEAMEMLLRYGWPGNVRELLNSLEYAFVLCREGSILPQHLPAPLAQSSAFPPRTLKTRGPAGKGNDKELLIKAMEEAGGNKSEAARLLGVSRVTIWKRLKQHNL